jgi:hypothetical protein
MNFDHNSGIHSFGISTKNSFYSRDRQKIQQTLFRMRGTKTGNDMDAMGFSFLARPTG